MSEQINLIAGPINTRTFVGIAALAISLSVLIGCVTHTGTVKPAPVARASAATEDAAVVQLDDDRDGFIIKEVARLSDASRRDFERAVALLDEKAYGSAIVLLEAIIEQSPGVTAPYINLGIANARMGKPEQAETQFKAALELFPGHPVASNEYGLLCRKAGRFDEARTIFQQALAGFPNYYPLHRNLGILCDLYLNDLESALGHYKTYSQAMPQDDQVKMWIADLRARLGVE